MVIYSENVKKQFLQLIRDNYNLSNIMLRGITIYKIPYPTKQSYVIYLS